MVSANSFVLMTLLAAAPNTELWEFTAPWCASCESMNPVVQQLADEGTPIRQIPFDDYRELAKQANVTSLPCFLVVSNGKILNRKTGAATKRELQSLYQSAANRQPDPQRSAPTVIRGQQAPPRPFGRISEALNSLTGRVGGNRDSVAFPSRPHAGQIPTPRFLATAETPRLHPDFDPIATASTIPPLAATPLAPLATPSQASPREFPNRSAPPLTPKMTRGADPVRQAMDATVRIRVEDPDGVSLGTGTIIHLHEDEALVLTCGHIFRDSAGKGAIYCDLQSTGSPQRVPARLVRYDLQRDIGLISFRPGHPVQPAQVLGPGYTPRVGEPVFAIGCNQGAAATVIENEILNVNRYHGPANLVVGGRPIDGRSGGGLFSRSGALIGICNAADPEADEGLYAALGPIHAVLDASGLDFVYQNSTPDTVPLASHTTTAPRNTAAVPESVDPNSASLTDGPGETEVICIVRPKNSRNDPGKAYVLDRPSKELLGKLSEELGKRGPHQFTDARLPANAR